MEAIMTMTAPVRRPSLGFPFDFGDASFDWALLIRVLLVIGIGGAAIGVVVHTVSLIRAIVVGSR
jgi:hypothetical protein